jgi:hypothetical protein
MVLDRDPPDVNWGDDGWEEDPRTIALEKDYERVVARLGKMYGVLGWAQGAVAIMAVILLTSVLLNLASLVWSH